MQVFSLSLKRYLIMRLRILAKQFKRAIPEGYEIAIPEDICNTLKDDEVPQFFKECELLGLKRNPKNGKWFK